MHGSKKEIWFINYDLKMTITKSLFVEFSTSPKLARRHTNNKPIYTQIIDTTYGAMDGESIGQAVEDLVLATYIPLPITRVRDELDRTALDSNNSRHEDIHICTQQLLQESPTVLYQPGFLLDDIYVTCDILVRNDEGTYDLIEIKAKNNIRKKTKAAPLLDELIADMSIQAYVLRNALGEKFSWRSYIAHLDSEYIKNGPINPRLIVQREEVSDELMSDDQVEMILATMKESLDLPMEQFDARYPYDGRDYMTYFGQQAPYDSIRSLTRLSSTRKLELYDQEKIMLADFDQADIESLYNKKGEPTKASTCLDLRMNWPETVDIPEIRSELNSLVYPLYFYDYETINGPVPLIEWTSPRQQVVVQYSLHKVQRDGTYTHHEAICIPWEESNERILQQMIQDMDGCTSGTYIVRYKGFENSRNSERAMMHTAYKTQLEYINTHTFDLMEIFSQQLYYHRDFQWSNSIKKVLPVMTDISYAGMNVPNWAVAMELLSQLISWSLDDKQSQKASTDLLEYCKLDTWAMVAIWEKLRSIIE